MAPGSEILRQEIFGPVAPLVRFDDDTTAVELANATPAGLIAYVCSADLAHALAVGSDPNAVMAELMGKATGVSKGRGGSMHLADLKVGIMPSLQIVGAGIPVAAGIAFAFQQAGDTELAANFKHNLGGRAADRTDGE